MSLQTVLPQWNQRSLTRTPAAMRLQALCEALRGGVEIHATHDLVLWDTNRPYGRRVLHESATLEAMIAGWTPHAPCAPHDHGGSIGAIRVLVKVVRERVRLVRQTGLRLARRADLRSAAIPFPLLGQPLSRHGKWREGGD